MWMVRRIGPMRRGKDVVPELWETFRLAASWEQRTGRNRCDKCCFQLVEASRCYSSQGTSCDSRKIGDLHGSPWFLVCPKQGTSHQNMSKFGQEVMINDQIWKDSYQIFRQTLYLPPKAGMMITFDSFSWEGVKPPTSQGRKVSALQWWKEDCVCNIFSL